MRPARAPIAPDSTIPSPGRPSVRVARRAFSQTASRRSSSFACTIALNGFPPRTVSCLVLIVRKASFEPRPIARSGGDRCPSFTPKSADPRGLESRRAGHDRGRRDRCGANGRAAQRRGTSATRSWRRRRRTCTATPSSAPWPGSRKSGASETDTFWTWRDTMYRFALMMSPEDVEAVAAQLYVEMLEAGFAAVAEFHYLHHAPDGSPYEQPAEMASHILSAARTRRHRNDAASGVLRPFDVRRRAAQTGAKAIRQRYLIVRASRRRLPAGDQGNGGRDDWHCAAQPSRRDARANCPN